MLPNDLNGPEESIFNSDTRAVSEFISNAARRYPDLPRDFVTQICYELPSHFNGYFPEFDIETNKVVVRRVSASWVQAQVRYDSNDSLEAGFYGEHVDAFLKTKVPPLGTFVQEMFTAQTWPFRPVIVGNECGIGVLGSKMPLGKPFHLIEGCHRVSYLLRMLALGHLSPDSEHSLLEVV